jgi:hypothetical protein
MSHVCLVRGRSFTETSDRHCPSREFVGVGGFARWVSLQFCFVILAERGIDLLLQGEESTVSRCFSEESRSCPLTVFHL